MIELKHISKGFDGVKVIKDVSSVMKPGQCNLIIGSSGSGKTVLMKCMVGLFTPDAGEVLYDGRDFIKMDAEEKKRDPHTNRHAFPGLGIIRQPDS